MSASGVFLAGKGGPLGGEHGTGALRQNPVHVEPGAILARLEASADLGVHRTRLRIRDPQPMEPLRRVPNLDRQLPGRGLLHHEVPQAVLPQRVLDPAVRVEAEEEPASSSLGAEEVVGDERQAVVLGQAQPALGQVPRDPPEVASVGLLLPLAEEASEGTERHRQMLLVPAHRGLARALGPPAPPLPPRYRRDRRLQRREVGPTSSLPSTAESIIAPDLTRAGAPWASGPAGRRRAPRRSPSHGVGLLDGHDLAQQVDRLGPELGLRLPRWAAHVVHL